MVTPEPHKLLSCRFESGPRYQNFMKKLIEWLKWFFGFGKPKATEHKRHAIADFAIGNKVEVYDLVKKTSLGHHGWYNSNKGLIRKPIQP